MPAMPLTLDTTADSDMADMADMADMDFGSSVILFNADDAMQRHLVPETCQTSMPACVLNPRSSRKDSLPSTQSDSSMSLTHTHTLTHNTSQRICGHLHVLNIAKLKIQNLHKSSKLKISQIMDHHRSLCSVCLVATVAFVLFGSWVRRTCFPGAT